MKNTTTINKLLWLVAVTSLFGCTDGSATTPMEPGMNDAGPPGDAGSTDPGEPRECERGADCPTGSTCVSGQCEPLACAIPSDCPVGYACEDGACGPADGSSPGPGFDPRRTEPVEGDGPNRMAGIVTDLEGRPVPDVRVTVDGEPVTTVTNDAGAYELRDVPPGARVVHVTADGYLGYSRQIEVAPWETVFLNARLMPRAEAVTVDPSAVAQVGDEEGHVTIPANALVTSSGAPVEGPVQISVTPLDPTGPEVEGAPGDYVAVDETEEDGMTPLVSYGMVDLRATDEDGEPVDLAEGEEIEAVLPAPEGLEVGDTIPTWVWDPEVPGWIRQDTATVEERDGELVLVGSINQTNIVWNCDDPEVEVCYTGQVLDCGGIPVRGAEVELIGNGVNSMFTDRTDEDGRYMVRGTARGGAIVRARLRLGLTEYVIDSDIVPIPDSGCGPVAPHRFTDFRYTGARIELGQQEVWSGSGDPSTVTVASGSFFDPLEAAAEGLRGACDDGSSDELRVANTDRIGGGGLPEVLDVGNPILIEGDAGRLDLVRNYEETAEGALELTSYFMTPGSQLADVAGEQLSVDIPGSDGVLPHTVLSDALHLPDTLVVTSPSADGPREVDASAGLPLRWEPSATGATLAIMISSAGGGELGLLGNLEDDGAFDVSPEHLESFAGQRIQVSMIRFHDRYEQLSTGPAAALRGFSSVAFDVDVQ